MTKKREYKKAKGGTGERNPSGTALLEAMKDEDGKALEMLEEIQGKCKGNPRKQWHMFMKRFKVPARTGLKRVCGARTQQLYKERGEVILRDLPAVNMHVQNLTEFGPAHARAVLAYRIAKGDKPSTIQNLATVMRRLCIWIGKADALPALSEIVEDLTKVTRTYTATEARTLASHGIDRSDVYQAAHAQCPIFGSLLEMETEFGLRRKESMFLVPAAGDEGYFLRVRKGTKGGKPREIPIETPEQRVALDRAKQVAAKLPGGILTFPRLSWEKAQDRFKYLCKKIGLTAKGKFKTVPHGLRREFACDLYERVSGYLAPVVGGLPVPPEIDRKARKVIALALGHNRPSVANAYVGSNCVVMRQCDRNQKALYERCQEPHVRESLKDSGVTLLRLVGKVAAGALDPQADTMCAYEGTLTEVAEERAALTALLAKTVGSFVLLVPMTPQLAADDRGLEVF